jgi:uncharacterized protein
MPLYREEDMLVEFSVGNFRSFKERQTLSMAASHTGEASEYSCLTGFSAAPSLALGASIHGANASGKSNLIQAMSFCESFIIESSKDKQKGEKIEDVTPFLFSEKTQKQPSEFEIVFIHEDALYQYGFTVDSERVYDEWLYATPKDGERQKIQKWFVRDKSDIMKSYVSPNLKGEKEKWKSSTRDNALFLSTAVQWNSEEFSKPFKWIQKCFHTLPSIDAFASRYTAEAIKKDSHENLNKASIVKFIRSFDTGISDINVVEKDFSEKDVSHNIPEFMRAEIIKNAKGKKHYDVYAIHEMEGGEGTYPLDFDEESEGTKVLFAMAGPILDILENGYTLVVDELHNSLHPHALKHIIALFHNKNLNKKNAQLIFTGHNTSIMSSMDSEETWLVEKRKYGESILFPLSSFNIRKGESIEKRYLAGRYKGVPVIEEFNECP